ncbi:MAG: trimethylamine methyltransferase family protein, partial [Gammaproteobacteria bacterium]
CIDGPVHFLGHAQTLGLMQREYVYPEIGDRASPKEWNEQGATNVVERARARVREILTAQRTTPFAPGVDEFIRSKFNVLLVED